MDIDRRQLLIGAALAGAFGPVHPGLHLPSPVIPDTGDWHPLTRSLLERVRRIDHRRTAPARAMLERTIRQFADASGYAGRLVIKWSETSTAHR